MSSLEKQEFIFLKRVQEPEWGIFTVDVEAFQDSL